MRRPKQPSKESASRPRVEGFVDPAHLYTAEEARQRLRVQKWAWRSLVRRTGLKLIRHGRRSYVLGRDLVDAFKQLAETQNPAEPPADTLS